MNFEHFGTRPTAFLQPTYFSTGVLPTEQDRLRPLPCAVAGGQLEIGEMSLDSSIQSSHTDSLLIPLYHEYRGEHQFQLQHSPQKRTMRAQALFWLPYPHLQPKFNIPSLQLSACLGHRPVREFGLMPLLGEFAGTGPTASSVDESIGTLTIDIVMAMAIEIIITIMTKLVWIRGQFYSESQTQIRKDIP